MVNAVMNWQRLELMVDGHAGADEKGKDIVCAGISMMVSALIGVLEDAQMRGRCTLEYTSEDGKAKIMADPLMGSLAETKAYFRMCVKGLQMVREEYPGNIRVTEFYG